MTRNADITNLTPAAAHAALVEPVADYLVKRAKAEVLLAEVAEIKAEILASDDFRDDRGRPVTDARWTWMICDEQAPAFRAAVDRETNKRIPNDLPADHCPALVARDEQDQAERAVLNALGNLCGFDPDNVYSMDLRGKLIAKAVELVQAAERMAA